MKQNNNKRYGLTKERELKKKFEADGLVVVRSRGSFGLFDMICYNPVIGWKLVQVKTTKQRYASYGAEINKIKSFIVDSHTRKELWIYWSPCVGRTKRGWECISIE